MWSHRVGHGWSNLAAAAADLILSVLSTIKKIYSMFMSKKCRILFLLCVQSLSHVQLFATPWTTAHQTSLSFTISLSLFKLVSIESVMPSNHLILCYLLPSIFPSISIFSNELAFRIRWPKYWSFSISSFNEYSRLISFGIDWFDLLAADGLKLRLRECGPPGRQGAWGARALWIRQTHSSPFSVALFCPHSHLRQLIADMNSLVQK